MGGGPDATVKLSLKVNYHRPKGRDMLTKITFALIATLVLAPASPAFAQSYRQIGYPHRRAGSVPALTNLR